MEFLRPTAQADLIVSGGIGTPWALKEDGGVQSEATRRPSAGEGRQTMSVVFEHVKVGDLPEAWRRHLAKPAEARVTVRIEEEAEGEASTQADALPGGEDPAFGIWRDREDMDDVAAYLRKMRAPRYRRDGTRNER